MKLIQKTKGFKLSQKFSLAPYNNIKFQLLIIENSKEETIEGLNKKLPDMHFDGTEHAFVHKYYTDGKNILIGFNLKNKYNSTINADCIAHESVHAKNMIYESIGQINECGHMRDENEAYLVGYLTHIIFDFFVKTKNLNKINFEYNERHY